MTDIWKYVLTGLGVMLTASTMLWRSASYVGSLEERIKQLEERANRAQQRGEYFHGKFDPEYLKETTK